MIIETIPGIIHGLSNITDWSDAVQQLHLHSPVHWTLLGDIGDVKDPNVLGQMQAAFNNFIKSGQVWALGIGLFFGYLIRGITA
jgi:hypothetical protein